MGRMIFDILETNIAAAIGIALLCLSSGKLRKRYGAGWMKLAWVLLAVRLLIPYNFSMPFAEIRLLNYTGFEQERDLTVEYVEEGWRNAAVDTELGSVTPGQDGSLPAGKDAGQAVSLAAGESDSLMNTAQAGQPGSQVTGTAFGKAGNQAADVSTDFSYTDLLIKIWITGVGVSLFYFLCSYLLFYIGCKKNLRPVTNTQLIKEICRQQKEYTGRAKIMAYKSSAVSSPMLTGVIRPKLVLPADAVQWDMTQLELIMAHELCHYRKKDLWLKMLMVAACCVNWFNPMVYVMKKQFAYDMELACDGTVLEGRDDEERESYARVMLNFAGGKRGVSAFSTGFSGKGKQMKARIDYMLDTGAKKKGILSIVTMAVLVLAMNVVVSCGYREGDSATENDGSDISEAGSDTAEGLTGQKEFDYNHVYNDVIRVYQGDLYLAKKDGIYFLERGQGEEQLLYADDYDDYRSRGMEIDGKYLYFCGGAPEGKGDEATVFRMDLETHEVVDALASFNLESPDYLITNVSVYEGNLYVAVGAVSERFGFVLNENGEAVEQLDQQAEDFLYREYNEYMRLELVKLNNEYEYGSEEYWKLVEEQNQKYLAVMDVASAKKLLGGRQVVSQYKDESLIGIYLENEDGTYEYICDTMGFPMLVTDTGIYYPDISGGIWYADFETKQAVRFYAGKEREPVEISLVTYDADYVYLLENKNIGEDMEMNNVTEEYIVRVPRTGGEAQKVYRFKEQVTAYGENGWYRHCGVYDGRMYFDNRESFSLDPEVNHMQAVNSGEPCGDALEITRTVRAFADAYFANDEETLRGLLTEDFEGEAEMYAYPEQAEQIRENHIGGRGMPNENVAVGVTCYVYYEFGGHAETGDALAYLSMQMTKTQAGFRVRWYGIEL